MYIYMYVYIMLGILTEKISFHLWVAERLDITVIIRVATKFYKSNYRLFQVIFD